MVVALLRAVVAGILAAGFVAGVSYGGTQFAADTVYGSVGNPDIEYLDWDAVREGKVLDSSVLLTADGEPFAAFNPADVHRPLEPGELPDLVADVIVAAEDQRFYEHGGIDVAGIGRALLANLKSQRVVQGGSTISQQLAKLVFTSNETTLARKLRDAEIAIELEKRFTKTEIITAYANHAFLGSGAYGFAAGALEYFDTPLDQLTLGQVALLVGLLPAPTTENPRIDPERAEENRQLVLDRVASTGQFSESEIERARDEKLEFAPSTPAVSSTEPWFSDYVRRYLVDEVGLSEEELFGGSLEIHTSLRPHVQASARAAIAEHLPNPAGPSAAVTVVDPHSGHVVALVGGRDWESSQVNVALGRIGGGSGRQTGSSFKPFVLAEAFEQGWSPLDRLDAPREYLPDVPDPKPVHNYTDRGYGIVSVREATLRSINTAFVGWAEELGVGAVADRARSMGIELPQHVGPSMAIGAYESSTLAMASAYGAFATDGHRVVPSPVTAVIRPSGERVELPPSGPSERVIESDTARLVTDLLADNVRSGTATRAALPRPAAAKTGTSNDHSNAWLVGYTPQYSTAVWVGFPAGNLPMRNIGGFSRVAGGTIPSLIWHDVMAAAHDGLPVMHFPPAPTRAPLHTVPTTPRRAPSSETERDGGPKSHDKKKGKDDD